MFGTCRDLCYYLHMLHSALAARELPLFELTLRAICLVLARVRTAASLLAIHRESSNTLRATVRGDCVHVDVVIINYS